MRKFLSTILVLCMVISLVGVVPTMKAQAKGISASSEMKKAPSIKLDKIYTFGRLGYAGADISVSGEKDAFYYVKFSITSEGDYYYVFRSTSLAYSIIRMYDSKGRMIADSAYRSNKADSARMRLTKGTYYIGITTSTEDATGSICVVSKAENYKDELHAKEPVNGNRDGEFCNASLDIRTAPLVAINKSYSFGREGFSDGNIRIPNGDFFDGEIYYVKFYVTQEGYYEYDFDANSYDEVIFYLFDAFGKRILDTGDMEDGCEGGYVKLKPGVYFVGLSAWYQYSEGIFTFEKIAKPGETSITSLKAKKKGFDVKWKKSSRTSGYQIEYATNASMKGAKRKSYASWKSAASVKGLLTSKKYYVRIRSYRLVAETLHEYSSWSKVQVVKTK